METMTPAEAGRFALTVLDAFAFDGCDQLFWRTDGDYAPLSMFVNVSDMFEWATSDLEAITPADVALLERTRAELRAIDPSLLSELGMVFAARKRGMRPQGALYAHVDERVHAMLDAAGPAREVTWLNPQPRAARDVARGTAATPPQDREGR